MPLKKRFGAQQDGMITVTSALLILIIIVLVGGVVDFGNAFYIRSKAQSSLDAAVLAAANEARAMVQSSSDGDPVDVMKTKGEVFFKARLESEDTFEYSNLTFNGQSVDNTIDILASVRIRHNYFFLPLINIKEADITITSGASVSLPIFVAIDFVVDASGSMGIGATNADQDVIFDEINCAFACHTRGNNSYQRAQDSGGEMRIDVARRAIVNSIDTIEDNVDDEERVALGLHMFSSGPIETIRASTHHNATKWNQFSNLTENNTHLAEEWTGTNIAFALEQVAEMLPASGDGSTDNERKRFVIVISDFIENSQSCTYSNCWFVDPDMVWSTPLKTFANHERIQPPSAAMCDALKDKNITVFLINTTYLIPWGHPVSNHNKNRFSFIEDDIFPVLNDRLSDCAGVTGSVIEATSVEDIEDAIEEAVRATVAPLHLYQQ